MFSDGDSDEIQVEKCDENQRLVNQPPEKRNQKRSPSNNRQLSYMQGQQLLRLLQTLFISITVTVVLKACNVYIIQCSKQKLKIPTVYRAIEHF